MQAIVIALRGCPSGWLGAYGNEWVATPNLDRLACESVVFDQHFSDCPEEQAARRAWTTGQFQFPLPNGQPDRPDSNLLADLRNAGVRTILVRANHPDTDVRGFDETWSEVLEARPQAEDQSPLDELARQFPKFLERLGSTTPWLIWIEIDRLLPPWDVPQDIFDAYLDQEYSDDEDDPETPTAPEEDEEDDDEVPEGEVAQTEETPDLDTDEDEDDELEEEAEEQEPVTPWYDPEVGLFDREDRAAWEWLRSSYAAVMTALDTDLGEILEQLQASGLDSSTAILVTSDFAWPLGEHGQVGPHRPWLHEEFVHLPLLMRLPGNESALRRVSSLTQTPDVLPTLLDLFGLPANETIGGRSFLPLARGDTSRARPYAVTGLRIADVAEWSLRSSDWVFRLPSEEQDPVREMALFSKPADRWEMQNVLSLHRDWIDHVRTVLTKALDSLARGNGELPKLNEPGENE